MAESKPLRLAYIGAGGFTNQCIYPQLGAHGVELAAVCDLDESKAQRASRQYGFKAVYTDFRVMLDREHPDAVICIGGPRVHYEVGREVLTLSYPLYIQKSPAPSSAQTRELAALAAERDLVCHVGFNLRSSAAGMAAKQILTSDGFGPATLVIVRYGLVSGRTLRDAVMDQHCHAFDTLRWLGGEIAEMAVKRGQVAGDRGYVAAVRFESGAVGSINFTSGQTSSKEFLYFEVTGTGGHYFTCHDFDLRYRSPGEADRVYETGNYGGSLGPLTWMGYVPDVANFFAAVRGTAADRSPVGDAVATMELCEEAYRQLREQGAEE